MSQAIILRCPNCNRRCQVRTKAHAYEIKCKRCGTGMRVPEQAEIPQSTSEFKVPKNKTPLSSFDELSSLEASAPVSRSASSPRRRKPGRSSQLSGGTVAVQCAQCNAKFQVSESECGQSTECPLCNATVNVPNPFGDTISRRAKKKKNDKSRLLDGDIAPTAKKRIRKKDRIPTGIMLYIDGVLTFPFHIDILLRWISFSFLVFLLDEFIDVCLWCFATGIWMALRAFVPATLCLFIMVGSYAATTFQAVFAETASGSNEVKGWIEFDKAEWFMIMLQYGWLAGVAGVIGYLPYAGIKLLAHESILVLPDSIPLNLLAISVGFSISISIFPFIIISAFEQHSFGAIFSKVVFKSLFREWWSWGIVVMITWLFFVPWIIARMLGASFFTFYGPFLISPIFAGLFLIYARLLGRLAWKIAQSADWE